MFKDYRPKPTAMIKWERKCKIVSTFICAICIIILIFNGHNRFYYFLFLAEVTGLIGSYVVNAMEKTKYCVTKDGILFKRLIKSRLYKFTDIKIARIYEDVVGISWRYFRKATYRGIEINLTNYIYDRSGMQKSRFNRDDFYFIKKHQCIPLPMDKEVLMALQHNGIKILIAPIVDTEYRRELIRKGHKPDPITGEVFHYE